MSDIQPVPAATVVLVRDGPAGPEALMVRRHQSTAFMGGAYVFPGGRVEPGDGEADETWCSGLDVARTRFGDLASADAIAYHVAAARELFEEAGVLLAYGDGDDMTVSMAAPDAQTRFGRYRVEVHAGSRPLGAVLRGEGLRLTLEALLPFAHWVTPPIDVRRFDARFFLARLPPDQIPAHDDTEVVDSAWIAPADAIARCERGEIVLPVPTWTTLRELERFPSVEAIVAWAGSRRVVRREPRVVEHAGDRMLLLPGDPLSPDRWDDWVPPETRFVLAQGRWRARRAADH